MGLAANARAYFDGLEYRLQRAKYVFRGGSFSRFNEQQIIWKYVSELFTPNETRTAVDIGAGNGMRWSNTYSLFLAGWSGIGIEADERKYAQLVRAYRNLPIVHAC